ncbi:hypothetical protein Bca101_016964 [Brassica carinata]
MEESNISQLPHELILKIFSLLPLYEESVATRLLTNEDPWKLELLPVVMYNDFYPSYMTLMKFMSFVYGSLLLNNNDQILERLDLALARNYPASAINFWVKLAVKRSVRKLRITMYGNTLELPSCLSTCVTLKSLILHQVRIMVVPSCFRLPSLKSLHLLKVSFSGDESLAGLLQSCPDLEYLVLKNVLFNTVPPWFLMSSLKSLHLLSSSFSYDESVASLLQKCPVLEDLVVKQIQVFASKVFTLSSCTTLKTLTLSEQSIKVALPWLRLPSLKSLHLISVKFSGYGSIASFLPICPVVEYLFVDQTKGENAMFKDVPDWFYLPSLKSLHLLSVIFSGDESLSKLIQRCPVLEDLVINKTRDDNVMIFNINSPSLRSLSIDNSIGQRAYVMENHGFVINAPFLEKINFKDTFSNFLVFEHMPEVIEANVQVICGQSNKFIGSLTSIRHLSFCSLSSEYSELFMLQLQTPYPSGTTFPYLEHLELCTCSAGWANLLVCILKDAPTIKHLKLKSQHRAHYNDPMLFWKEPKFVPECLSTHLETMEWRQYEGTEQERNVAAYILANTTCLKMATFSTRCGNKHHRMLKKLKKLNRVSETSVNSNSKSFVSGYLTTKKPNGKEVVSSAERTKRIGQMSLPA